MLNRSRRAPGSVKYDLEVEIVSDWPQNPYLYSLIKRGIDLAVGFIGCFMLALMFPFVAFAIKINSRGPIFYLQRRAGLHGRSYQLIKFRTMIHNAEVDGKPQWAIEADPRITSVGKVLRSLYIDEFPQWLNVVSGDMSVVGPRPERPELAREIINQVPNFHRRLLAKPGITGLAQINYKYVNTMAQSRNKLRHDVIYISRASVWLDCAIMLRTLRRIAQLKGS